jgi:hypothetical protein
MGELRRGEAERLIEQQLPRRVRDVILAADHMRDLHQRIVDDHGEVVLRAAVGADDDGIADYLGVENHLAADEIVELDLDVVRHLEADDRPLAALDPQLRIRERNAAAGAAVLRRLPRREIRLPARLELLRGTEAVVRGAGVQQLVCVRRVEMQALGLPVRAMLAADVGPLVPVEAEPAQILEDAGLRLAGRSLGVGVLDPQDERAVLAVGEEPVEERRPRIADVELPGRAWSKSYSHRPQYRPTSATACAATASPRPTASTPSFVFALMLTASGATPSVSASCSSICRLYGPSFGRSSTITTSTFSTVHPSRRTIATASRSKSVLTASFQRASVSG